MKVKSTKMRGTVRENEEEMTLALEWSVLPLLRLAAALLTPVLAFHR